MSPANVQHHIVAEVKASEPLNRQVWEHEAIAKRDGLKLVVELFTKKQPVSKALSKLWKKRDKTVAETLSGIYLLRVNIAEVGLKASLGLTPYTVFGVPLFIAWNPVAQLLSNAALNSTDVETLLATLSAFFEDVVSDRKHTLHPAPRLPFGSKSAQGRSKAKPKRPRATALLQGAPTTTATHTAIADTAATNTTTKVVANTPEAATEDVQPNAQAEAGQTRAAVLLLEADLGLFLENALAVAIEFLVQSELRADGSLHSLRQLDAFLDENAERTRSPEFVAKSLAALGVYLGMVVQTNANATWFVDSEQASPIDALGLRVTTPEGEQIFRPVALALERLHDASKGFYGHAVALCRTL